jgi:hypothetical protein
VIEEGKLVSEPLFIHMLVQKLVLESLKSPLLELFRANLILLLRCEVSLSILLDTCHQGFEALEVV